MSLMKWLNQLLFMENVLGIYRSYCCQEKKKKYLIIFQIFTQTMLHTMIVLYELYLLIGRGNYSFIKLVFGSFGGLAFLNALSSIVTGICYSHAFMSCYRSISRVSEWFQDDKKLNTSIKRIFYTGILFNFIFYSIVCFRNSQSVLAFLPSDPMAKLIPIMIGRAIVRYTVVFQHFVLYVIIMITVYLFKSLTSSISAAHENVGSCDSSGEKCTREQIQAWVELYRDLLNSCEKVSLCFGRQYFFSMFLSIAQYIVLAYNMMYLIIKHVGDPYNAGKVAVIIFSYISVMMMPLFAGQMVRNQGVKFHRALVRLYNTKIIVSGKNEMMLMKDFLRLVKKNPLEIRLMSKITVGMYMLPIILALTVNYLIFMLQINHII